MTSTQDDLQHKSHEAFAQRYFHVVDDLMDPEQFAKLFNTDATFVLGNFPVAHGHEQIAAASNGVFSIVSALKHRVTRMYSIAPDHFICEGSVQYTMKNGQVLEPIALCSVYQLVPGGELIQNYRAYIDPSPLLQAAQA